jgi:hypothetical protein
MQEGGALRQGAVVKDADKEIVGKGAMATCRVYCRLPLQHPLVESNHYLVMPPTWWTTCDRETITLRVVGALLKVRAAYGGKGLGGDTSGTGWTMWSSSYCGVTEMLDDASHAVRSFASSAASGSSISDRGPATAVLAAPRRLFGTLVGFTHGVSRVRFAKRKFPIFTTRHSGQRRDRHDGKQEVLNSLLE